MLRWILGDDAFFEGIRNYFSDPEIANGFATTEQLIGHLEQAGDTTLTGFFEDWYYGQGYPVYTLTYRRKEKNELEILLSQTPSHSSVDFFEMPVPVRLYNADRTLSADYTLNHIADNQSYTLNPEFEVAEIVFDPEYRLLSKTAQIVKVPEIAQKGRVIIYPNPVSGELNISLPNNDQIGKCFIYSMEGTLLKTFDGNNKILDISNLSSGNFILEVYTKKMTYHKKFVKY
jgi:hypothetical protein